MILCIRMASTSKPAPQVSHMAGVCLVAAASSAPRDFPQWRPPARIPVRLTRHHRNPLPARTPRVPYRPPYIRPPFLPRLCVRRAQCTTARKVVSLELLLPQVDRQGYVDVRCEDLRGGFAASAALRDHPSPRHAFTHLLARLYIPQGNHLHPLPSGCARARRAAPDPPLRAPRENDDRVGHARVIEHGNRRARGDPEWGERGRGERKRIGGELTAAAETSSDQDCEGVRGRTHRTTKIHDLADRYEPEHAHVHCAVCGSSCLPGVKVPRKRHGERCEGLGLCCGEGLAVCIEAAGSQWGPLAMKEQRHARESSAETCFHCIPGRDRLSSRPPLHGALRRYAPSAPVLARPCPSRAVLPSRSAQGRAHFRSGGAADRPLRPRPRLNLGLCAVLWRARRRTRADALASRVLGRSVAVVRISSLPGGSASSPTYPPAIPDNPTARTLAQRHRRASNSRWPRPRPADLPNRQPACAALPLQLGRPQRRHRRLGAEDGRPAGDPVGARDSELW